MLTPMFCKAQNRTPDGEVITSIGEVYGIEDTGYVEAHYDTVAVDILISFRGIAIVVDGYAVRERHYDYFGGGAEYFYVTSYLDEDKKPLNKGIQVWQHKFK